MHIRKEQPSDNQEVHALNVAAFETDAEARLVELLRNEADLVISMVAEEKGQILGHILFSPVTIDGHPDLQLLGLAPMAVLPKEQRKGIGGKLVESGLKECRDLGAGAVVVLGHPDYYPKFGFQPAEEFSLDCEYDVPPGVFRVLELKNGYLKKISGTVRYHKVFRKL